MTFDDIAGHLEVKKDLQFIIDFLKTPQKYRQLGARMPKEIIVIGATNRFDMLDSALTRVGRFDMHVCIPLPEYEDRIEMIKIHSKNKRSIKNSDPDGK
ncbi:ATPase family associated with various cellular activities (AAA) [Peptoclostridium litorale DSM 5388]|uniref:ATPase AAA-type core domain-containing protein n=1 Tax=Peptoclostridium litorale DSM 5388 TaxID=1121324 RepID=A0A069RCB6_PEPLI|nr:AAA family ATPase [Peptoclostridium litorale]KDR94689.1 hypothetical protein CLIT_13c00110 [Peptoclostridium litorale DSM 5388]SIO32652.1 ATPase family associated with various cellular activities (AAA) [Peptoclostridium litorale DSM 5388]